MSQPYNFPYLTLGKFSPTQSLGRDTATRVQKKKYKFNGMDRDERV